VVLVEKRFAYAQVIALLPDNWFQNQGDVVVTFKYEKEIKLFWTKFKKTNN
jgi:hypothetical protein